MTGFERGGTTIRYLRLLAAAFVAVLVLAACASDPAEDSAADEPASGDGGGTDDAGDDGDGSKGTIRVGLINPVTGVFAVLGQDAMDGFELYVEQNGGQLGGFDVEISKEDTAGDPNVAIEAVGKLVEQDEVDVLSGFVHSGVAYASSTQIIESGVPLIITTAGADNLTQRDHAENIYRVSYTGSQDAAPMGDYTCNELGYETVAIVSLDYAFGWEAAGGFAKAYEDEGCDVVQELYVPLGTEDWGPFVQQIDTSADAVWGLNSSGDAIRFMQAYRDFGVDLPLVGHGGVTDTHELLEQQEQAEGVISSLHYAERLDTPLFDEFVAAFEEAYGRFPTQVAENAFVAAKVYDEALSTLDTVDREALLDAMAGVSFDAPRGPVSFDEYGQVVHNVYIREVQEVDGEWVNAVRHTYPDVSQFWTYDPEEWMAAERFEDLKGTWAE